MCGALSVEVVPSYRLSTPAISENFDAVSADAFSIFFGIHLSLLLVTGQHF